MVHRAGGRTNERQFPQAHHLNRHENRSGQTSQGTQQPKGVTLNVTADGVILIHRGAMPRGEIEARLANEYAKQKSKTERKLRRATIVTIKVFP